MPTHRTEFNLQQVRFDQLTGCQLEELTNQLVGAVYRAWSHTLTPNSSSREFSLTSGPLDPLSTYVRNEKEDVWTSYSKHGSALALHEFSRSLCHFIDRSSLSVFLKAHRDFLTTTRKIRLSASSALRSRSSYFSSDHHYST